MFAMASFIFHMEHGAAPEISLQNGRLALPKVKPGNPGVDDVIQKAWLGHCKRTSEMVQHLAFIDTQTNHDPESSRLFPESRDPLKDQIKNWRSYRESKFGKISLP